MSNEHSAEVVRELTALEDRISEATDRGWLGEVDGLQVSLTGARQKLEQMRKLLAQPPVIPSARQGSGGPEQASSRDRAARRPPSWWWPARPSMIMPSCMSTKVAQGQ